MTGQSGSGKSSLVNRLRGLTPKDKRNPLYAKVGVTQTTKDIKSYPFPSNPLLELVDLPGCGTQKFSIDTYAEDMKFQDYDAFVLVTANRFTENDKTIATMIETNYKKPFFFCRSKMDATMEEEAINEEDDFDPEATEREVRDDCRVELGQAKKIYLISQVLKLSKFIPEFSHIDY